MSLQAQAEERLDMALHLLYVAMDSEADPKAREAQWEAILSVRQAVDRLSWSKATAEPQKPKPIEEYETRPTVTSEDVLKAMPVGVWLTTAKVMGMVDWTRVDPTRYGKQVDTVHRLNSLVRRGAVERDPPSDTRRRSHNTSWRRTQ